MQQRLEAGISDAVEDVQPLRAPPFESLLEKRIEVLWKYFDKDDEDKPVLVWATGCVKEVADGVSTKKSKRCRNVLKRAGAVRGGRGAKGRERAVLLCVAVLDAG